MPHLSYRRENLVLRGGETAGLEPLVRDFQRDLRRLGYLRTGIDGDYGPVTEAAVRALQYDLLNNNGASTASDGPAPVRVVDYNRGRVRAVTGDTDQGLAACVAEMLDDARFPRLPFASDPASENRKIREEIARLASTDVPIPFLMAVLLQESGLKHFNEPPQGDDDTFVVVGLDTNAPQRDAITSRGYGAGQYTLFHHPPRPEEVKEFIVDVGGNVRKAMAELREKFIHFVNGPTGGTRADDRIAEWGRGPLRACRHARTSPLYMRDCAACVRQAGLVEIRVGVTPLHRGTAEKFEPTQYHLGPVYQNVPVRKNVPCDWPYAVRRYNGSGMNSYHYQAKVLRNLATL